MPIPYILDPFQRIISLTQPYISYEYRELACPSGKAGAMIEKRKLYKDMYGTLISADPWLPYAGQCITSSNNFQVYLQGYGVQSFGNSSIIGYYSSQEQSPGGDGIDISSAVNIYIHAENWIPPGLPPINSAQYILPVYYDLYVGGTLLGTMVRSTEDFWANYPSGPKGGFNAMPQHTIAMGAYLPRYMYDAYQPKGTLIGYVYDQQPFNAYPPRTKIYFSQGTPLEFKVVARIPGLNYTQTAYNIGVWY